MARCDPGLIAAGSNRADRRLGAHDAYPVSDVYVADPGLKVIAARGRGSVGSTQRINAFSQP
jgi:hypothetical protein